MQKPLTLTSAVRSNPPTDITGTRSSRSYAHGVQVKLPKLVIRNFSVGGILLADYI